MFKKIYYNDLNARQKENYNFSKITSVLADYGFSTIRLSDDWQSADFIAQHIDGETFLEVQLKGRLTFSKKYFGKNLYIAFNMGNQWYLYPHDALFGEISGLSNISNTDSWVTSGIYHFPTLSKGNFELLQKYKL